ncbi:flavodoxin domain-containing protein [Verrucomicrobiaceae bacterium 227]
MIPSNAPFSPEQSTSLTALLSGFSPEQSAWLSGFLAGGIPQTAAAPASNLTVLYGTESGNSEILAAKTVKAAKARGGKAVMKNLADLQPADLSKLEDVALIISTWGEGDPPEAVVGFHEAFLKETPDLKNLRYSVCALGDTSYEKFCEMGKIYDTRFEELGAKRVADREDCDVDFDDAYSAWLDRFLAELGGGAAATALAAPIVGTVTGVFDKKNPFPSEVLDHVHLNGVGTSKETIHLELSLEGSGLVYEAGDALAVVPFNAEDVVSAILEATGFSESEEVEHKAFPDGKTSLGDALRSRLDITALSRAVVKKYLALGANPRLEQLLSDDSKSDFSAWIWGRQIVDLLIEFPVTGLTAQQFVSVLRKLPPRLYSIASSPKAHPGEVHLTVAAVRYDGHGKPRKGVASTFLADEAKVGEKVLVYVHTNKNFRLPEDHSKPIIMVGPGTGIAPFRAFVEERAALNATGDSWLFFGDQKYNFDFLYQLEWQEHLQDGNLTRLDVAFSRDQPEKVYVQDIMRQRAAELFAWLEKGAYFYVCGDAERMAKDVHQTLIEIVAEHGQRSPEEAAAYVDALKKDKRYQRDVY